MSRSCEPAPPTPLPVIPVIDLKGGVVVHAVGGQRERYSPIVTPLVRGSEPLAIARALAEKVGHRQLYLADLDALEGAEPAWDVHQALLSAGCELWLDVGLGNAQRARTVAGLLGQGRGVRRVIAALESLPRLDTLAAFLDAVGAERLVFSLDLRDGNLMTDQPWLGKPPLELVDDVLRLGVERIIVLDVGGVGRRNGPQALGLCRQIRLHAPHVELVSGGGVRGVEDLARLRDAGCDAALVSTWLHA